MATTKKPTPKSDLSIARAAHAEARAYYERLRSGHAENNNHDFSESLAQAEADMLTAEIAVRQAEAAAQASDGEYAAIVSWLVRELEATRAAFDEAHPPTPALNAYDPASITKHTDALVQHQAACKLVRERLAEAVARLHMAWSAALAAQECLRRARVASGGAPVRAVITSRVGDVPVNPLEIDEAIERLRDVAPVADVVRLEFRRDALLEEIAEHAAELAETERVRGLSDSRQAFESNYGRGSASP